MHKLWYKTIKVLEVLLLKNNHGGTHGSPSDPFCILFTWVVTVWLNICCIRHFNHSLGFIFRVTAATLCHPNAHSLYSTCSYILYTVPQPFCEIYTIYCIFSLITLRRTSLPLHYLLNTFILIIVSLLSWFIRCKCRNIRSQPNFLIIWTSNVSKLFTFRLSGSFY